MSTPNQVSTARLSGPPIPGAQINEPGKRCLIAIKASTSLPCCEASCGASTKTTMLGSVSKFSNEGSWFNLCHDTGSKPP